MFATPHFPRPSLRRHVACYFVLEAPADAACFTVRTVPDGCCDLMFRFAGDDGPRVWCSGPRLEASVFSHTGPMRLVGAQLFPGVARLTRDVDLTALSHELASLPTVSAQLAHLDARLDAAIAGRDLEPRVARALGLLAATEGAIPVDELSRRAGASPRNLQRLFREWVGLSPKQLARVLRFQGVLVRRESRRGTWAELAADLGYADQSHLIRDVAAFAGLPPSELP